jgi:hypothetical protein
MKLKVRVEDKLFEIQVGQGLSDFTWLAIAAA